MYVGVIRGDMPGPIFIADVEPLSQTNFPTEPSGQSVYVARPNAQELTNYLGGVDPYFQDPGVFDPPRTDAARKTYTGVPAGIESGSAVSFPVVITGANNVLSFKNLSSAGFTAVTVASGSYATMTALVAALNAAMSPTGLGSATTDVATGTLVVIQSSVPGVGSFIQVDSGSINATLNLTNNQSFTMPAATAIIAALNPVGGPLNVSPALVLTTMGASPAVQGAVALIAPHFTETTAVIQSFQVGVMSKFLEASYTPDPTRLPALALGAAITVVQDDGHTLYTAPLPIIASAVHNVPNPGDITITGTDLGNVEFPNSTTVFVKGVSAGGGLQPPSIRLGQHVIVNTLSGGTQGVVSATSIVIPASLLAVLNGQGGTTALGVAGSTVEVLYTSLANGNYGAAANIASAAVGAPFISSTGAVKNRLVVTLTGLTNMTAAMVGFPIVISGAASPGNNGSFIIESFISATSVTIYNDNAVAPDTNNGAIIWTVEGPIPITVT